MASGAYSTGITAFLDGTLDWDDAGTTYKAMLVQAGYTLDKEAHAHLDDVSASRYTGTTDQTLASGNRTIATDATGNEVEIRYTTTVTWSSVSIDGTDDAIGVIIYRDTGTPSTSELIAFDDSSDVTPNGSDITYTPASNVLVAFNYGA